MKTYKNNNNYYINNNTYYINSNNNYFATKNNYVINNNNNNNIKSSSRKSLGGEWRRFLTSERARGPKLSMKPRSLLERRSIAKLGRPILSASSCA